MLHGFTDIRGLTKTTATIDAEDRLQSVSDGDRMQACRPSLRSFRGFGVDTRAMLRTNIFGSTEQCFDFRACTALPTRGGTPGPPVFGITSRNKNTPDSDRMCSNSYSFLISYNKRNRCSKVDNTFSFSFFFLPHNKFWWASCLV